MTHPALEESELYDDVAPSVVPFTTVERAAGAAMVPQAMDEKEPAWSVPRQDSYLAAINAAMEILSYRLILLLAVLANAGLFGLATWMPDPWRLGAAAAFGVIVTCPLIFFYARR